MVARGPKGYTPAKKGYGIPKEWILGKRFSNTSVITIVSKQF